MPSKRVWGKFCSKIIFIACSCRDYCCNTTQILLPILLSTIPFSLQTGLHHIAPASQAAMGICENISLTTTKHLELAQTSHLITATRITVKLAGLWQAAAYMSCNPF